MSPNTRADHGPVPPQRAALPGDAPLTPTAADPQPQPRESVPEMPAYRDDLNSIPPLPIG